MAVIKRGAVAEPTLPKETVEVKALGGEVVVRGLMLTERLDLEARIAHLRQSGSNTAVVNTVVVSSGQTTGDVAIPTMLATCVLDADGRPLWSEEQWQAFGCRHHDQAVALFDVAWRLSGFGQEAEAKN